MIFNQNRQSIIWNQYVAIKPVNGLLNKTRPVQGIPDADQIFPGNSRRSGQIMICHAI